MIGYIPWLIGVDGISAGQAESDVVRLGTCRTTHHLLTSLSARVDIFASRTPISVNLLIFSNGDRV
jgi:hypothetical protein